MFVHCGDQIKIFQQKNFLLDFLEINKKINK